MSDVYRWSLCFSETPPSPRTQRIISSVFKEGMLFAFVFQRGWGRRAFHGQRHSGACIAVPAQDKHSTLQVSQLSRNDLSLAVLFFLILPPRLKKRVGMKKHVGGQTGTHVDRTGDR